MEKCTVSQLTLVHCGIQGIERADAIGKAATYYTITWILLSMTCPLLNQIQPLH